MIDEHRVLASQLGKPGDVPVTTPLERVLTLVSGAPKVSDGAVEVAR